MPFFTADTHFGHAGARALYRRPFATVAEMDEAMVQRWNDTVGPGDEVWHLCMIRHNLELAGDSPVQSQAIR